MKESLTQVVNVLDATKYGLTQQLFSTTMAMNNGATNQITCHKPLTGFLVPLLFVCRFPHGPDDSDVSSSASAVLSCC
ncbi:MAG TPA: hypothetical protein VEF04_08390 [Blastocatellia bacterium]|nr:hypothetical protein [Blastocatellia bacterium]